MYRLTTDKPTGNTQAAHNLFFIKNGTTACNLTDNGEEISLYDLIRKCGKVLDCDFEYNPDDNGSLSEFMYDSLFDLCNTPQGILAHFYTTAWALAELRAKLKQYEDTGLEPQDILSGLEPANIYCALSKLKEYDQLKAEGRLIGLSCAIGDMVYCKTHFSKTIQGYTVGEIKINAHRISFLAMRSDGDLAFVFYPSDIGKTVFLSKNEAEKALHDQQFETWQKSQGTDADKLVMATLKEIFNEMDKDNK